MMQLNTRVFSKDTVGFDIEYTLYSDWILDGGHIDLIIQGAEDILTDVAEHADEKLDWFASQAKSGDDMLVQVNRIYSILQEMHTQNQKCYAERNAFEEFEENYELSLELLTSLNIVAREGQIASNEYLRNSVY